MTTSVCLKAPSTVGWSPGRSYQTGCLLESCCPEHTRENRGPREAGSGEDGDEWTDFTASEAGSWSKQHAQELLLWLKRWLCLAYGLVLLLSAFWEERRDFDERRDTIKEERK